MSTNLITRVTVAAIAIPIILWISYEGGGWLFGMLLVFLALASWEFLTNEGYAIGSITFWLPLGFVLFLYTMLTGMFHTFCNSLTGSEGHSPAGVVLFFILVFYLLSAMLFAIGRESPSKLFERHSRLIWGILYLGLTYPVVYLVGSGIKGFSGGDSLLFLFGLLWVGDTCAMGFGSWLGKHKLAPSVSPNKTVEGLIGGIGGALVIGVVMYFWKFTALGFGHTIALAAGCSIFGQLGDLVESMWKRSLGIKDSSALIPGHGGVLDRFDSLLFAAPFMYAYFYLIA